MDVAVVIPNFNGARWLPGVLGSVAAQTVAPAEVLGPALTTCNRHDARHGFRST